MPRISARPSKTSTDQKQLSNLSHVPIKLYEDIVLPDGDVETTRPHAFPSERQSPLIINRQQHKKWLDRSNHLASKLASKRFKALVGKRVPLLDKQDVQTEAFGESGDTESGEERIMLPF